MLDRIYAVVKELSELPPGERDWVLDRLEPADLVLVGEAIRTHWDLWRREKQILPSLETDWRWTVAMAGRGWGKTRFGAESVRREAESGVHPWISIVAPTYNNLQRDLLGGPSGLLSISPSWHMPRFYAHKNQLVYPKHPVTGIITRVSLLSADKPDRIRGSQASFAWADEIQSWTKAKEAFEMLDISIRIRSADGQNPRGLITMTSKSRSPFVRDLILGPKNAVGKRVPRSDLRIIRGSFEENLALSPEYIQSLLKAYPEGSIARREELNAEIIETPDGALWNQDIIDQFRERTIPRPPVRFLVSVDPSRSRTGSGDECGIVVGCRLDDGHIYILSDVTVRGSIHEWAYAAAGAANKYTCDIIYEQNRLSPEIQDVLRLVSGETKTRWIPVTASEKKEVRAGPVAMLYQNGFVHHVGVSELAHLEAEMCMHDFNDFRLPSPNRIDALVHLVTELGPGRSSTQLVSI
jgi:phage terminase large subunit-like protein